MLGVFGAPKGCCLQPHFRCHRPRPRAPWGGLCAPGGVEMMASASRRGGDLRAKSVWAWGQSLCGLVGWAWGQVFMRPAPPPDVDECAWEADLCQEDQHCVNLLGSYHCLPDCRPGFRVAADGASCEGDQSRGLNCPAPGSPVVVRVQQRACRVSLGRWAFREAGSLLGRRSPERPGRKPELGTRGPSTLGKCPFPLWAPSLSSVYLMKGGQVRDGKHRLLLLPSPLMGDAGPCWAWSSLSILFNTASPATVTIAALLRDET